MKPINLSEFNYNLPDELIAKFPLTERDSSKLLFYNKGNINNESFKNLPNLLPANASLLFNKSKVVPARLEFFKETGTRIEVFLLEPYNSEYATTFNSTSSVEFVCLIGNKKRWKEGQILKLKTEHFELVAEWTDREKNIVLLKWNNGLSFSKILEITGELPIPPYLHRNTQESDYKTYQTVYAEEEGAVAAPTAGLHFTDKILNELKTKNIETRKMTLHVSAGTFLPVKEENVLDHPMHSEIFYFDADDVKYLFESDFLIPVGTTSMRMSESLFWMGVKLLYKNDESFNLKKLEAYDFDLKDIDKNKVKEALLSYLKSKNINKIRASTSLMIVPGYEPALCKGIITNFHQPSSTLVMLIASLIGKDWKKVYKTALENNYRFLSYGDSSLLVW